MTCYYTKLPIKLTLDSLLSIAAGIYFGLQAEIFSKLHCL